MTDKEFEDHIDEAFNDIAYRDILMNTILGLVCIIAAFFITMKMIDDVEKSQKEPPGNMAVSIVWPVGNTDVDLWVIGPGEKNAVGYSNKGGVLFNLLRDDLGAVPDATGINYENAYTRGIVPGDYTINVHCYRCPSLPIDVDVEISLNTGDGKGMKQLVTTRVNLIHDGQEKTAISFKMTKEGDIVPDSMNAVFRPLRSPRASSIVGE